MERIRVLHCLQAVYAGGVERRRLSLARRLDVDRFEQRVLCTESIGRLSSDFASAGCDLHALGPMRSILSPAHYAKALKLIKEYRPHIIHGAVFEGVAVAAIGGRLGRVPIVIGEETSAPTHRRLTGHLLFRALAAATDHMVAVSPASYSYLTETLKIRHSNVSLIMNGVERPPAPSAIESATADQLLPPRSSSFIFGTVGRLVDKYKRVSDLIRALRLLRNEEIDAHLVIVGDGLDRAALESLSSSLNLVGRVWFVGHQANPTPFFRRFDAFALASSSESFGLAIVEAMYANLPVVATRVGGIPFVVKDEQTGILVPPFSPEALAGALKTLASNRDLGRRMGAKGLERALEHFSAQRYVSDVSRLYTDLVLARRVHPAIRAHPSA